MVECIGLVFRGAGLFKLPCHPFNTKGDWKSPPLSEVSFGVREISWGVGGGVHSIEVQRNRIL